MLFDHTVCSVAGFVNLVVEIFEQFEQHGAEVLRQDSLLFDGFCA